MYINNCKWCKKEIVVDKQCLFALHISNCDYNPNKIKRIENYKKLYKGKQKVERKTLKQNCPKCEKEFEIKLTDSEFRRNKYKKYCSTTCGNSRTMTNELKSKISKSCKNSEKVKIANRIITEGRKKRKRESKKKNGIKFTCLHCGEYGYDYRYNKDRKYHNKCWKKISGGIRKGSSRGKCGWYKGYWCDSSYELGYLIYCLEHNIKIERNKRGYEYNYKGKKHLFYPDFRVNGDLVEIKNFRSKLTDIKLKSVNEKIDIFYKDTINQYLVYVINKYGKDFINLYEKTTQKSSS